MEQGSLTFSDSEIEKLFFQNIDPQKIDPAHRALGKQFAPQILSSFLPPVYVADVSEKVGKGLFAEEKILKGSFVGEYGGEIRENNDHWKMNHYLYSLPVLDDIGRPLVIDATKGNLIRYVNHSATPNLKPCYAFLNGFYHVIFIALEEILAGEQLCYDYGKTYWQVRETPESLS